jgi:hypothetical protein
MYFVGATWPYDVKKTTFFFANEIFEEWKQEMDQILDNKDSWIAKNI